MFVDLEKTFRWFGPQDAISLAGIKQTGATGIVTALHGIPCGEEWPISDIDHRNKLILASGLKWSVVESVNIHESIKTGGAERDLYIEKYKRTIQNLAACGIDTICYNFMPVLDWTRTHLDYRLKNNESALRYDSIALRAFDIHILQRPEAVLEASDEQIAEAERYFCSLNPHQRSELTATIMAGLPGTNEMYTLEEFRAILKNYSGIDQKKMKENLAYFLRAIIPVAEDQGIRMCIHPDDPPFSILGLPRIVSTEDDLNDIIGFVQSPSNGITFCSGSLGANPENDLPGIIKRLGSHIHFLHLRNVRRYGNGSFYEDGHLTGSSDMAKIMTAVICEQKKRAESGSAVIGIPLRPDHGHSILNDLGKKFYPGYSMIGRLKGLSELTGLEMGIKRTLFT
jgi:mannonate dehydratase